MPEAKRCPYCAEQIHAKAKKCKHCGEFLDEALRKNASQKAYNPGVAAVLSFFLPGAGQIYKGQIGVGLGWLAGVGIGYLLFFFPGVVLHIVCIVNAYQSPANNQTKKPSAAAWIVVAVIAGVFGIGVIAILTSIVIVAINPTKQLSEARNAQRRADVNTILNATYQYAIDHDGSFTHGHSEQLSARATEICNTGNQIEITDEIPVNCTDMIDLSDLTNDGMYLIAIPADPQTADDRSTKYTINKNPDGTLTVAAPNAENGIPIAVTR